MLHRNENHTLNNNKNTFLLLQNPAQLSLMHQKHIHPNATKLKPLREEM